jgi:hypothetical protein
LLLRLEHRGARVDRLLARSGELTVRRPRASSSNASNASAAVRPTASLIVPLVATVAFTLLLTALLVLG